MLRVSGEYTDFESQIYRMIGNFEREGRNLVEGSRNTIKVFDLNGQLLNIKSFRIPHLINSFVYRYFRKSKARRSFEFGKRLLSMGIRTPAPVAFFEEHIFTGLSRSYYVCEHLNNGFTFRDLINNTDFPDRKKILKEFTRFTFELHEKEVWFLDHSPGNTIIQKEAGMYRFYLVDINRMQFRKLDEKKRIENFSRLSATKEMLETMASEYADLANWPVKNTIEKFLQADQKFRSGRIRKKRWKKMFGRG